MNFPIVYKYQIFDYFVSKTNLITHYFGPMYGPPYAFWALNENPTVPIDSKKSHLYNNRDWSSSNSCTLDWYTFLALSSCLTHKLYLFNCSFVFGEINLFEFTLICCILKTQLAISCWSKDIVSGWLPSIFDSGNFHTTCTVVTYCDPIRSEMKHCKMQKFHWHVIDYDFLIANM